MMRPWMLFSVMIGLGLAYVRLQGYLTWPQALVFGLCFLLVCWRLVHKSRKGLSAMRDSRSEAVPPKPRL